MDKCFCHLNGYEVKDATARGELIDARADYKGNVYDNIGDHIRGVSGQLYGEIDRAVSDYLTENPAQTGATAEQVAQIAKNTSDIEGKVNYSDVVDNLLSTATDLPLSANQGNRIYNMLGEQLAYYKSSSTTSFRACHNDSAQSLSGFLDAKVHNVISSFEDKKMHQIVDYNGGPYFFVNLSKFSNSYYCGTIHNYDTNQGCMFSFFSYCSGTFVIYTPRIITYGK